MLFKRYIDEFSSFARALRHHRSVARVSQHAQTHFAYKDSHLPSVDSRSTVDVGKGRLPGLLFWLDAVGKIPDWSAVCIELAPH